MRLSQYQRVVAGIGFAFTLIVLLFGCLTVTAAVRAQSTNQLEAGAGQAIGTLIFTDSAETRAGAFQLMITELVAPPADSHYALWLHSDQTTTLKLGKLTLEGDRGVLQGSADHSLLIYDHASIRIEADGTDIDGSNNGELSEQIILTATLPKPLQTALAQLLAIDGSADATTDPSSGFIATGLAQTQIAVQHTGFMDNALSEEDMPQARRHIEHIINVLDGKSGFVYSDWDRDGRTENPGDGFGVRPYLDEAYSRALALVDATTEQPELREQQARAELIVAALEAGRAAIPNNFDRATKVFASDTVTEATGHAQELILLIDGLEQQLTTAYALSLEMATYTFYAPAGWVTPTPLPPTATATHTRFPSPSPTTPPATPPHTHTLSATTAPTIATRTLTMLSAVTATGTTTAVSSVAIPTLVPTPLRPTQAPTLRGVQLALPVGQSWRNPADGSLYVYVPGGEFSIGSTAATAASPREEPQHMVSVDEFWLQQTETTNGQYARCVTAGACTPPGNNRWTDPDYADHPVTDVDWQQAGAYAAWVGGRLPTEAEWEKACRSTDGRTFPWGNEAPTDTLSNYNNNLGDTAPVGSYLDGATPLGIVDLSGNVWEWVSSLEADYPYSATDGREEAEDPGKRVVRGGSFYYTQYQIRCAARTGFTPDTVSPHIGFRVVIETPITEWRHALDEALYVYVPSGEFAMGSTPNTAASPREEPRHTVTIDGFWLQQTETTNTQYARCVREDACTPPDNNRWTDPDYADHPVTDVDWQQANAYAAWVGGRLPTEAEWEKACRSTDGRTFPWGETEATATLSNYNNSVGDTTPVGSYPDGASPFGALDLSGNVWEWVSSLDVDYPYDPTDGREETEDPDKRVVRGGSFYYTQYQIRCAARTGFAPETVSQHIGFRVVLAAPQ